MKTKLAIAYLAVGALLAPLASFAGDGDSDRSHPTTFVKDSVITTKVKTKLANEHLSSLAHIQVDPDANGMVWLSGNARSQAEDTSARHARNHAEAPSHHGFSLISRGE